MTLRLPTWLTLARIVLIPVLVGAFYLPVSWSNVLATAVFAAAAVTDWLDGYLARRLGLTSAFGAFLDPVADKLMVAVVLILLVEAHPSPLFAIPAAIIIGREIAIASLREWMAIIGEQAAVAVNIIGKIKTTAQMVALFLLLYREPVGAFPTFEVGVVLLFIAALLTLWSMALYLKAAWPALRGE